MEISGHCAVCGNEASRGCLMCEDPDAVYCCAEHQFSHWISRHKDECTYDTAGLDISEVIQQKRTDLRARASHLCKDEFIGDDVAGKQALCYSLAALRSSMRRSHKYTQLQLRDCVLLASVMKHLGDREASAYFWEQCADVISREPYGEWARNKVVYEYAADECEEMGEPDAAVSVLTSHMHHIERTFGKQQLDAAECAMRICQVHVSTGSYDAAIESWTHAVSIRERHSSRSDVKERLIDNYRFGSILHTLAGQHEQAVDAGMRGRDLARAGNIDKGMAASGFSLLVGSSLVSLGRLPEALGYFEESYRTRCAVLGEAHEESIVARKRMNGVRKALGYELIPGPGMKSKDKGQAGEAGDNSASGEAEGHTGGAGDGEGGEASPSAGGGRQGSKAQPGASLTDLLAAAAAANRASGKTSREASAGEASGSTPPGPSSNSLPMLSVPRPKAGPGSRQVDSRFGDGGPSSKRLKTGESSPQSPGAGEDEDGGYPSSPVGGRGSGGQQPVTPPPPAPPLSRASRQALSLGPAASSRGVGVGGTGAGGGPGRAPASAQAGDGDDIAGYADEEEDAYDDTAALGGEGGEGEVGPDPDDFDGLDPDIDLGMGMEEDGMDLGDGEIVELDMGMGAGPAAGRGTRAGGGGGMGMGMGMGPAGQGMGGSGPGGSGAAGRASSSAAAGRGVSASYPGPQGSGGPSMGGAAGSGTQAGGGLGRAPGPLGVSSEGQDGSFESMGGGMESEYGLDTGGFDTMAASPSASPVPMGMDGMGEEDMGFPSEMGMGQPGGRFSSPAGDAGYGPSPWNSPTGGPAVVAGGAAAASLARAAAGLQFSSPAPRVGARMLAEADTGAYGIDNGFNDVPEEVFEPGTALGMDRSTLAPIRIGGGGGSSLLTMGLGSPMVRPLQASGERASLAAFFDPALVMGGGMVTAEDRQAASAGGMAGLGVGVGYGTAGEGMSYGPGGVMGQGQSLSDMDLSMTMEEGGMGMGGVGMAPGKGGPYGPYSAGAAPPPTSGQAPSQGTAPGAVTGQQQYSGPGTYSAGQGAGASTTSNSYGGSVNAQGASQPPVPPGGYAGGTNAAQATLPQGSNAGARGVQEYGQSFTSPTAAAPPPSSNSRALPLPPGVRVTEDVRPVEGHAYRLVDVTGVGAVADVKVVPVGQKGKYYQDSDLGLIDEALDKLNSKTVAGQTVHLRHVITRQADKDRAREAAKRSTGEYLVGAASVLGKPIYNASEGSTPAPSGGPGMGTPMGPGQAQGAGMMIPGSGGNQYNYAPGASASYTFAPGNAAPASQAGARLGPPPAGLTSIFGNAEVYASYEHDGFAQAVPGSTYYGQQQGGPYPESKQDGDAAPATGRAALYSGMGLQAAAMSQAASNAAQSAAYAAAGAQRASAMAATGMASGYAPGAAPGIIRPSYGGMRSPGVRREGGRTRIIQVEVEEDVLPVLTGGATAVGDGDDTSTVGTADPQIADDGSVLSYGRPGGSAVHEPMFVDMEQAQAYADAVRRETHVSVLSGGRTGGRAGRGGNASALAGLVPKNYGLGLVAVDSSALGALGAGAEDGMPGVPSVQSPAEAALYLEAVTERLTRSLAALVTRADSIKTARRQGDGGLAVPAGSETALDGKEEEAKKLQQTLKQALEALATTSDKAKDDKQVLEMRDVLFTVIAEVGKQVDVVLQGSHINMDALATLAAAPPGAQGPYGAAMVERAQRQRRQSSAGASVASGQSAGGGLVPTSTDEFSRKAAEMSAAVSAVRQNTLMSVAAVHMQDGGAASGALGGKAGLMAMIAQARANVAEQQAMSGLVQPGLIKAEPNTEGRRMKAVFLSGDEIMASLQSRLLTLGLFKSMGNARRQFRIGIRSFFLGVCVLALKQKKAAILASKVQILGMMAMIRNERQAQIRSAKVRALGAFIHSLKIRDNGRRATKVLMMGFLVVAKRRMDAARRRTELFALGLFVTVHRTQGNPQGFKYGQKPTRKPTKAPRVRGIHWDTLGDVKGSVWERKSSTVMLRQLFPDLKAVFTEKEKEKKGGMTEEEAAAKAKEANKPKEISFLEAKDSKNMAIALNKFKSVEGFKEGKRFEVVKDALCKMDEAALGGTDGVSIIEKNLPNAEQLAQARDFGEDQVKFLAFPENYVWWMTKVPMLADRVKCITLKVTFPENLALVEKDLRLFLAACAEVLDNPRLVEFLVDVVRPFGNELNRSSGKKDAQGIKIEGLKKLAATKTADNSMTSLYYIVAVLQQHRPSLLELCNDFKGCAAAAKLAMQSTETNLKQIVAQAKTLNDAMERANTSKDTIFIENLGSFAAEAAEKVKQAEEKMATLKGLIVRVAEFLGEKEKSEKLDPINKPEGLFAEWYSFIDLLTKTLSEYKMKEAQKEKKAKEEAAKAAAAAEKAAKAAAKAAAGGGEGGSAKPGRNARVRGPMPPPRGPIKAQPGPAGEPGTPNGPGEAVSPGPPRP